jgi:hypothetical protein
MDEDFEFFFTGGYDPLWVEAERVKLMLGEIGVDIPEDLIHRIIQRHCIDIDNVMSVSTVLWYHENLASLRAQVSVLQHLLMNKDAGASFTMGVGFTQRIDTAMQEMIRFKLTQLNKEIHALVNTYIFDADNAAARALILSSSLVEGGLDQISMNNFYPRPSIRTPRIGANSAFSPVRGGRTMFGSGIIPVSQSVDTLMWSFSNKGFF